MYIIIPSMNDFLGFPIWSKHPTTVVRCFAVVMAHPLFWAATSEVVQSGSRRGLMLMPQCCGGSVWIICERYWDAGHTVRVISGVCSSDLRTRCIISLDVVIPDFGRCAHILHGVCMLVPGELPQRLPVELKSCHDD